MKQLFKLYCKFECISDQAKQQQQYGTASSSANPNGGPASASAANGVVSSLDDASSYATFELRQSRRSASNTLKSQGRR